MSLGYVYLTEQNFMHILVHDDEIYSVFAYHVVSVKHQQTSIVHVHFLHTAVVPNMPKTTACSIYMYLFIL